MDMRCDFDCDRGDCSDKTDCDRVGGEHFFKMWNGLNVPKLFVCDDVDCYDGSDEKNCLY